MSLTPFLEAIQLELSQTTYGQQPVELYEPIRYLMNRGGKRIRPLLTLLAAYLYTDEWEQAIRPALGVEVFHNFTLMHDDIMDQAPLRRGMPTVHEKWDTNRAILSGDVMLVNAYQLLLHTPPDLLPNVLERFSRTAAEVCEGQQLDMNFETQTVTEADYLTMIRLKTSVLLGYALELGGLLGRAPAADAHRLYCTGVAAGIGFQLQDDLLDVYGHPDTFGKQIGGDIIANKKTYLLIEALERAQGDTRAELLHWLSKPQFDKAEKVAAVTDIYNQLGIRAQTQTQIDAYFGQATDHFDLIDAPAERKAILGSFFQQLMQRQQ